MKRLFLFVPFVLFSVMCVKASYRCTVQIHDSAYIPIIQKSGDDFVELTSSIPEWREMLTTYNFVSFEPFHHQYDNLKEFYVFEFKDSIQLDSFIFKVRNNFSKSMPRIDRDYDPILDIASYCPNDPYYTAGEQEYLEYVNVPKAWTIAKHYPKVKVGISDTYFHLIHPDLDFERVFGPNQYGNSGHGTVVSGIVGATTDNNIGLASTGGLNTKLYGSPMGGNGVDSLVNAGCKVINCSWHISRIWSYGDSLFYSNVVDNDDVVLVFSAGNGLGSGYNPNTALFPASYSCCLSVSSIGYLREPGDPIRRNWKGVHLYNIDRPDSAHNHNSAVDVVAPGFEFYSTNYWHGVAGYDYHYNGTSFAAPIVTAVAAMVRAVNPNLTARQVMNIIKTTADPSIYSIPENEPYIGKLGSGKIDAYAAVRAACAVDLENETFSGHTEEEGCIVTVKNCSMSANSELVIDAVVEAEIISGFEVPLGCELEIL